MLAWSLLAISHRFRGQGPLEESLAIPFHPIPSVLLVILRAPLLRAPLLGGPLVLPRWAGVEVDTLSCVLWLPMCLGDIAAGP